MTTSFSRSISLPSSNPNSCSAGAGKSYHLRSTSLPCRSHPVVSQLEDELRATFAWQSAEPERHRSAGWLRSGLIRLELLHLALSDLLRLEQTRESLRRSTTGSSSVAERMLDDFLHFADAYGSFRSGLVSLQELKSAAQVAVRRRDEACFDSVARSLRKAEKEINRLLSVLRCVSKSSEPELAISSSDRSAEDAKLAGILREAKGITVSVSTAIFQVTAATLTSTVVAVLAPKSTSWTVLRRMFALGAASKKKKGSTGKTDEEVRFTNASEKLDALEACLVELESGSETVFRALVNTRVSLLNIITP